MPVISAPGAARRHGQICDDLPRVMHPPAVAATGARPTDGLWLRR